MSLAVNSGHVVALDSMGTWLKDGEHSFLSNLTSVGFHFYRFHLGECYEDGVGCDPANWNIAQEWYNKAIASDKSKTSKTYKEATHKLLLLTRKIAQGKKPKTLSKT